jgi:cytochrome c556
VINRVRRWSLLMVMAAASTMALPAGVMAQDAEPTPETQYRKALMQSMRHHMSALGALVGGDVAYTDHVQHHASAVHGIATMAGDAFPEATGGEGSRASDAIWENWDTFVEKLPVL